MYAFVVTVFLNFQSYPIMSLSDGQPVYVRTTSFRVALGHFATKAECEAYTGYQGAEFTFKYVDENGNQQSTVFQNVPTTVGVEPCQRVQ